jgi:outer membrane protein TolC
MQLRFSHVLMAFTSLTYNGCASLEKQASGSKTRWGSGKTERIQPVGDALAAPISDGVVPASASILINKPANEADDQAVVVASNSSVVSVTPNVEAISPSAPVVPNTDPIVTPAGEVSGADSGGIEIVASNAAPPVPGFATPPESAPLPIDLGTALELTSGQNPQVNYAREKIRESYAKLDAANSLWLPSLRTGVNYHKHEGRIQDVAGTIIETSRNSLYNGFGAQAVGAGSPAVPGVLMNFHMRDSMFQPRIAGQMIGASRQASQAATNDALLETAIAYCDLLEASQLQVIANDTNANIEKLAKITADYAQAGEGLPADADRCTAELAFRKIESHRAVEQVRIRSVRLARQLSNDPQIVLNPTEPFLAPLELIARNDDVASLVAQGLSSRPELTEQRYLVGEAVERLRREQFAPLVPSVLLGLSYGGNGGGLGSSFQNYGDRMDFDAAAFWEIRNFGAGELAARCEAQSRVRQARFRHVQALDRVAAEIVEAHAQVQAKRDQLSLAESAIAAARDSYRRNQERIINAQGLPIEVLQSITALDQAQRLYATTIADYNRAQFRLHRALGFAIVDKQ